MARVETDLFINAPADRCYQMWRDFESLPNYLSHVKEVRKSGDNTYHFIMEAMGQTIEYDAQVTEQDNRKIGWQATGGLKNAGSVEFMPEGEGCRMHLTWDEQVGGPVTQAAENLTGFAKSQIDQDLQRFKQACEQGAKGQQAA
jgi:uncharacterized membrane protein